MCKLVARKRLKQSSIQSRAFRLTVRGSDFSPHAVKVKKEKMSFVLLSDEPEKIILSFRVLL